MQKEPMNEPEPTFINRLILVGNGFDLAHGMKTRYKDFIFEYLQQCWNTAKNLYLNRDSIRYVSYYEDELIRITINSPLPNEQHLDIDLKNSQTLKNLLSKETNTVSFTGISFIVSSEFFKTLIINMLDRNWVDIENFYYEKLVNIITPVKNIYNNPRGEIKTDDLNKLNKSFDFLKMKLEEYLSALEDKPNFNDHLGSLIYESPFTRGFRIKPLELDKVLILNFNYTNTPKKYKGQNADIIHIHGELNNEKNPLIFGYGDERDETYEKLEKAKVEGVFTHIKSFDYFKTDNYSRLLAFLESEFDVYIMGHSCGLSDRTLLSTIFEHVNCRYIKIFYHDNAENYRKTTYEISRHFTDKASMRKRVLPITICKPMPQSKKS